MTFPVLDAGEVTLIISHADHEHGGGTPEKPVGLVHIAVAGPYGVMTEEEHYTGQRTAIKTRTVNATLDLLRRYLQKIK